MNKKVPNARNDQLFLPDRVITIGSSEWFEWLEKNGVFHYVPPQLPGYYYTRQEITVKKRANGYWYGLRTFNNKQTCKYIGKTEALDYEKLQAIVDLFSST